MELRRNLLLIIGMLLGACGFAAAQETLSISDGNSVGLSPEMLSITMDASFAVQGFVLAIGYDESLVTATDLAIAGSAEEAELIIPEVLAGGVTMGVIMDAEPPFEGQTIAPGGAILIAELTMTPVVVVSSETLASIDFVDGVLNSPPLSNVIVQGGLSVGVGEGLELNGGTLTIEVPPPAILKVEDSSAFADGLGTTGDIRILLDNNLGDVQGFVTAIAHDLTEVFLEEISLGEATELAGAEFSITNLYENGGTLGVILDFTAPFDGQAIPNGVDLHIATYTYFCVGENIYPEGDPAPPAATSPITFVDGLLGSPALFNVIVIGGFSIQPQKQNGVFTCVPFPVPAEDTVLCMETIFDQDEGNYAYHGQTGDLCFCYSDEDDYIQGLTMTVCYDCDLTVGSEWYWGGSIVEQVGVEYLAVQVDDNPLDGDGCEIVIAILLDALPPFEGQTLPQTTDLNEGHLLIGCLPVTVDNSAECDEDQLIYWCDDINGNGDVLLYNNLVIDYESIQEYERLDTSVFVVPEEIFQRGDCNSDDKVDLADSATMLANQFSGLPVLCPDACDANDDGVLNLADSVFLLNWLFKFGEIPPAPGPYDDGPDATDDDMLPVCDSDDTNC
ncbi:MAG: hypothetical protein COB10_04200 [Planctomycetota bacterium]|nr:MAG: hypothetical protein COB10_04200 [Planctomycetota bacterium]